MSPAQHSEAMMSVAHTAFGLSFGLVALIFVAGLALYFITRR